MSRRATTHARWMTLACLLAAGGAGGAAGDLGTFRDWRAHTFAEGESTVCSMWSQPVKDEGDYTRRGEIFAFVTHRPAEDRNFRVSFEMGYDFMPDRRLAVAIGGRTFALMTSGSTAWSDEDAENLELVRLMKVGTEMVVTGHSARGTETVDTYSLLGFTAALGAISEACRVR